MRNRICTSFVAFILLAHCLCGESCAVTILFTPDVGVISNSGATQVVTVAPSTTINFSVDVISAPESVAGYQLEFAESQLGAGELTLNNWAGGSSFEFPVDATLDSSINDTFVGAGSFSNHDAPVTLGILSVTAPQSPGSYLLTVDASGTEFVGGVSAEALPINDYGNTTIQVVPEPHSLTNGIAALLLIGFSVYIFRCKFGQKRTQTQ